MIRISVTGDSSLSTQKSCVVIAVAIVRWSDADSDNKATANDQCGGWKTTLSCMQVSLEWPKLQITLPGLNHIDIAISQDVVRTLARCTGMNLATNHKQQK